MWKDEATAADILLAAQDIQRFTERMSYSDFMQNDLVQAAVVQRIMLIGKAAKRLSPEFRADHSEIEWPQIAGMRDRCVHGYDTIKVEIVWEVVTVDAPAIERYLKAVVRPPEDRKES